MNRFCVKQQAIETDSQGLKIICSKIKAGMIVIVTTVSDVDSMSAI